VYIYRFFFHHQKDERAFNLKQCMDDQKMISRNISKCIFISVLGCGNIKSTAYFTFKMKKKVKGEQKHRTINKKIWIFILP